MLILYCSHLCAADAQNFGLEEYCFRGPDSGTLFCAGELFWPRRGSEGLRNVTADLTDAENFASVFAALPPFNVVVPTAALAHAGALSRGAIMTLPGQSIFKLRVYPAPKYSFCSLRTLVEQISKLVLEGEQASSIINVSDREPYGQHYLAGRFEGMTIPWPEPLFAPFNYLMKLVPGQRAAALRVLYAKLFKDSLYA
jgi:hypothetical protein